MKKILLPLLLILLLVMAGCVQTKSDVSEKDDSKGGAKDDSKVQIELLGMGSGEEDMNIVRDQLVKNGFDVKLNIQPDYGSFKAQEDAGNFDISLSGWTTVTGNPDYAVRSLFKTNGDYSILADPDIDQLIDQAGTETPDEYVDTYKELEQKLVTDKAYIAPLYISYKAQGINKEVVDADTVRLAKSRAVAWETIDFTDTSKRDSEPLISQQAMGTLTSLDPIKGNDGSINTLNTNLYVRLVNLTDDDEVISDGSLSYNHSIAEGNSEYYFILRDDINFAAVTDGKAVDTGEPVGIDDVIFSLNRAKDPNSVPDHRTYTLHEHIKDIEAVTDLSALDVKQSGSDKTVREALEDGLDTKVSELVEDKTEANSKEGKYQVIKMTTTEPFPQVLNYLAHQSAGIVSKKQVESINTYDVAEFDVDKDIPYGDQNTVTEGASYDNTLYASGPYILVTKNDYEAEFVKNPAYRAGSEFEPKITNVKVRFIQDPDSALSSLRNGEIHLFNSVPETKYDLVEGDDKLFLQKNDSNAVTYLLFNTAEDREIAKSEDLRKAVLYSINQDEFVTYYQDNKKKAYSTVSPLVDTGNELVADAEKVKELLESYKSSK